MIKIKPIIISASIAFVLSFVTALIAKTGIPFSLLKAFIFAVVFGGLAAGIQFVYAKFLLEGTSSISEIDTPQRPLGSKVDLVVSEEDLPNDGDALTFSFDDERHILTSEDVGIPAKNVAAEKPAPVSESKPSDAERPQVSESVAAENAKPAESDLKNEPPPETKPSPNPAASSPVASGAGSPAAAQGDLEALPELDNLPDFGTDSSASDANGEGGDDGVIEDSDFAEEGSVAPSRHTEFSDGTVADTKDSSLMAKAIQTVLAHEE
ncbi:MAG: hypothetical protein K2N58_04865 [Treponemataceae bacterium]|nr:hypothetical protein [Treponemataceae bacterium]